MNFDVEGEKTLVWIKKGLENYYLINPQVYQIHFGNLVDQSPESHSQGS